MSENWSLFYVCSICIVDYATYQGGNAMAEAVAGEARIQEKIYKRNNSNIFKNNT